MPLPTYPGQPIPGGRKQTLPEKLRQHLSFQDFGPVADCIQGVSGAMTVSGNVLTINDPVASAELIGWADPETGIVDPEHYVGLPIAVYGAGDANWVDEGETICGGA